MKKTGKAHYADAARAEGLNLALAMIQRKPRDLASIKRAASRALTLGSETGRVEIDAARHILERWARRRGASF